MGVPALYTLYTSPSLLTWDPELWMAEITVNGSEQPNNGPPPPSSATTTLPQPAVLPTMATKSGRRRAWQLKVAVLKAIASLDRGLATSVSPHDMPHA